MATNQEHRVKVGEWEWFYRQVDPTPREGIPVLLLHGLVSQSYGWRHLLSALGDRGFKALAPDWIGSGYSAKPENWEFRYTPEAYLQALESWIEAVELERFSLVVQGFLGSVGLQYALRHPEKIERVVILNTPLSSQAKLPWILGKFGIPLAGEMLTQDPLLVDRTLETGGIYRVPDADLAVFRQPFLTTSASGRALLATVRKLSLPSVMAELEAGRQNWPWPTLVAWGEQDPWLPISMAQTFVQQVSTAELATLQQVGHYPQHDWHEKVSDAVVPFLRRLVVKR
ncbi:MAG: alpha/beta fold hydrolase [Cyanophyceae cyanobacterium]